MSDSRHAMKPSANSPGMLIALEGIDGAGKSTQASKLAEWLRGSGRGTLVLHEPTRGPHGMRLRALMEAGRDGVTPHQEFTLFLDDRAQNVRENIRPALAPWRDRADGSLLYFVDGGTKARAGWTPPKFARQRGVRAGA
jgi:thymidylate kinase